MKKESRQLFKDLAYYSSLGFSLPLAIVIGLFFGRKLDEWFNTAPWLMFIFLGLGIAAAFRNIFLAMNKSKKNNE